MSDIQPIDLANATIAKYASAVDANKCAEWDTHLAVAYCDEGLYGAYGETCDVASEIVDRELTDEESDAIEVAFKAYQARLRAVIECTCTTASYREYPGAASWSDTKLDPDCPVHGEDDCDSNVWDSLFGGGVQCGDTMRVVRRAGRR